LEREREDGEGDKRRRQDLSRLNSLRERERENRLNSLRGREKKKKERKIIINFFFLRCAQ
jgi:hypothetical protein